MKKIIATILAVTLIFSPTTHILAQGSKLEIPTVNAFGAILMEAETGRVLWGKNEHEPLAMASTTKIMTAILALENGNMNDKVTVSARAAAAPRMKMFLTKGEEVRLGDLMLALMLESANDAAVAIAEHISGTVEGFCQQMTAKAHELGATNTHFETPNGLDTNKPLHLSTPYDLALITRYALNVPGFVTLTNTSSANFSSDKRSYNLANKNRLLHEFPGANGVKTGFTNKAGHCFVGAAKRDGMQLISVVLASGWGTQGRNQKWVDTKEILSFGFANYEFETIITQETIAGEIPVTRSRTKSVDFMYSCGANVPLGKNETAYVELYIPVYLKAPVKVGDSIGIARVFVETDFFAEIPLIATASAERHDFKTSLEKVLGAQVGLMTKKPVEITLPELFALPDLPLGS